MLDDADSQVAAGTTRRRDGRYPSVLRDVSSLERLVSALCPGYPLGLADLSDGPGVIRVAGELPDLQRTISIVGTRQADEEALEFAYDLGRHAALGGFVVVSGGAVGIDRAAHEGAIDAGGRTVVVLPTGLDAPYPAANHDLFASVLDSGCLLTEVEDGAVPRSGRFLTRNRLIAALGQKTVVVQAPGRSGALSTATEAARLGRPVFAVPAAPWDLRGSGNLMLLRRGARICVRPADVLSEALPPGGGEGRQRSSHQEKASDFNNLTQSEQTILESLGGRARHPDDLCQRTGIPAFQVQQSIVRLLVRGLIEERPGGRVRRCRDGRKPY